MPPFVPDPAPFPKAPVPATGLKGARSLSRIQRLMLVVQRMPRRLTRIPDSPHEIAKAFAVGVFIGVMPGLGAFVALLAAVVFRLSKAATVLGSLTTNPSTVAFVYAASYKVGKWILGIESAVEWSTLYKFNTGWAQELGKIFPAVLTGGVVVGLVLALASYALAYGIVSRYRRTRLKKLHAL